MDSRPRRRPAPRALRFAGVALGLSFCPAFPALNDWFVDQNAPSCATGTGGPQDPFCTITRAIEAASSGDRVLIAEGTYRENLMLDKGLTLIGGFGGGTTYVDGRALGSVVTQVAGTTVVLESLVITNGYAPHGGGIHIENGSPAGLTMTNVTVSANTARDPLPDQPGRGGGLYVPASATVGISSSRLGYNTALGPPSTSYYGSSRAYGGAISNRGNLTIVSTCIYGNVARATGSSSIYVEVEEFGNAIFNVGSGSLVMRDSLVIHNGIFRDFGVPGGGGRSAAIYSRSPLTIANTTITENVSGSHFGLGITWRPGLDVSGSTSMVNVIVWNHPGGSIATQTRFVGNPEASYSVIEGGWGGDGNLDQDPLFVDPVNGRWDLQPGSPCIDAGDPSSAPRGVDFAGNVRWLDGRLVGAQRVDMGAFEFSNVRLAVVGRTLNDVTIEATGTSGLEVFLSVARAPGEWPVPPWGRILFAPRSLWFVLGLGPIPVSRRLPVPRDASLFGRGEDVVLQALALGSPLGGGQVPGNFSNAVRLGLD